MAPRNALVAVALVAAALLFSASLAEAQAKLDGTYEFLRIAPGASKPERQNPRTAPPGQVKRFVIQGKRCALFDMMSGFQGTLVQKKGEVVITWYEGPAGKLKKKEVVRYSLSADAKTLTRIEPKNGWRVAFTRISFKPAINLPY